jgi:hypothetical protein
MRRYVPIVMPALMIYAAVALVSVLHIRRAWLGRTAGVVLTLGLMGGLVYQARFVLRQRDGYGLVQQLTQLETRLRPDAIILINEPLESVFADNLCVPLRFIFGHDIGTIRRDDASALPFIERVMAEATRTHRPVQMVAIDPIAPTVRKALQLHPVEMFPLTFRVLMSTFFDYPSIIQTAYSGIEIYDVTDKHSSDSLAVPQAIEIDIGALDAAFIRSGFHSKELLSGSPTARWTKGDAALDVPRVNEGRVTVEVRAMIFRPEGVSPAEVHVWLDGQEIGQFVPTPSWETFVLNGSAKPSDGTSRLEFKTETFNPARLKISQDDRDLGFLADWIKIVSR